MQVRVLGLAGWLVVVVAGCGDAPAVGEGVSGSRLRARYVSDDDGGRTFLGFHDRKLDVDCVWEGSARPRCLPAYQFNSGRFADAACTRPALAVQRQGCTVWPPALPPFLATDVDPCTGMPTALWPIDPTPYTGTLYQLDGTGACMPTPRDADVEIYVGRSAYALARFVGGEVEIGAGAGRLAAQTIAGEDGARAPYRLLDRQLDEDCAPDPELGRCVPRWSSGNASLDDTCQRRLIGVYRGCQPPRFVGSNWTDAGLRLWRVSGPPLSPAPNTEYVDSQDDSGAWTCTFINVTVDPAYDMYVTDATPLGVDEMAPVAVELKGDGRLQTRTMLADDVRSSLGLHDRTLDTDCDPTEIAPGDWRCLPRLAGVFDLTFYRDDRCTQAIGPLALYSGDPVDWLGGLRRACDGILHFHALGAEVTTSVYVRLFSSCIGFQPGAGHAYQVGPEGGFDAFARLYVTVD